jgi:glyoxylase-like metal-dependent hydrolase (beta-lactamase superfamily II)
LIGDEESKTAAIVDPQRDIDQYVEDARLHGLSIRHVFLTHFHADFIAGHLELKQRFSARIYLGSQAKAEYEFTPLEDGDAIEFGKVRLEILETPGHSPESISILVHDLTKDTSEPYAVLTGDTLFIGDVGRPDLRASLGWTADELGGMLYDSIQNKLLVLPDDTLVYPTHGAGSMCGKQLSEDTVSTMGVQRKYNYALQPMSKEKFVEIVTADQPDAPDYFTYDAVLNTKERLTLNETMSRNLTPLTLGEVLKLKDEGVQILDVRNLVDYEGAHLYGDRKSVV